MEGKEGKSPSAALLLRLGDGLREQGRVFDALNMYMRSQNAEDASALALTIWTKLYEISLTCTMHPLLSGKKSDQLMHLEVALTMAKNIQKMEPHKALSFFRLATCYFYLDNPTEAMHWCDEGEKISNMEEKREFNLIRIECQRCINKETAVVEISEETSIVSNEMSSKKEESEVIAEVMAEVMDSKVVKKKTRRGCRGGKKRNAIKERIKTMQCVNTQKMSFEASFKSCELRYDVNDSNFSNDWRCEEQLHQYGTTGQTDYTYHSHSFTEATQLAPLAKTQLFSHNSSKDMQDDNVDCYNDENKNILQMEALPYQYPYNQTYYGCQLMPVYYLTPIVVPYPSGQVYQPVDYNFISSGAPFLPIEYMTPPNYTCQSFLC